MKIYIGTDYKCHVTNDGTMREIETDAFEGKCAAFIEGYRYIPEGETWTNPQGVECSGVSPWRDLTLLEEFQAQYEAQQKIINEYDAALTEIETALGVTSE